MDREDLLVIVETALYHAEGQARKPLRLLLDSIVAHSPRREWACESEYCSFPYGREACKRMVNRGQSYPDCGRTAWGEEGVWARLGRAREREA